MVVLVNPNNPTSSSIAKKNILSILKKAKNSIVLIDEAYFEFYGITAKNLLTRYKNLIITRTFSKAWGLAGLRLGYIISNKCIIANLQKVISHYSVNTLALTAMNAALSDTKYVKNYVKKVKASKQYLLKELKKLKIKTYPANANFVIADFGKKCNAVCNQLRKKNILVRNRSKYPLLQDCLRLGIGTLEQSKILINSIKDILRKKAILFDMDGVLVDVNQSYRLTIKKTVEYFTKQTVTNRDIQKLKEKSGFNNDWDLSEALILGRGVKISKNGVIQKFQSFYLGEKDTKGLINNEKWLLPKKTLTNLSQKYSIGIVTGRPKAEALYILKKFGVEKYFDTLIAMEDYPPSKAKPDPFSINLALKQLNCSAAVYLGDSLDDIIAAKRAGIQSIGIPPPGNSSKILNSLLKKNGADIVLKNCNKLTEVLQ
jgi:HAD superfamily phosphatase